MSVVGSGAASGGAQLLPEVLAFSSSLPLDRQLLREDVIGSLAHLIMLARTGIVPRTLADFCVVTETLCELSAITVMPACDTLS